MDHKELQDALEKRLDKTDLKIEKNLEEVKALRNDINKEVVKTAILENQMAGVIKVGFLVLAAVIGIIAHIVRGGIQ